MKKKALVFFVAFLVLFLYIFIAAQPVPSETVLVNAWFKDLRSSEEENLSSASFLVPFVLGDHYGYVGAEGNFVFNKTRDRPVSISGEYWSEYNPAPGEIVIQKPGGTEEDALTISPAGGYPLFLDRRILLISKDQCSLSELDEEGNTVWFYDFESILTSIDAAGGYTLAGTLDGMIELLDSQGKPVFPSYLPAARITVIFACRMSADASKIALIAGIDQQRFLFLERYGNSDYRVTYHEFLKGEAFRREMHMAFVNNDSTVVFEQAEGLGIFDVKTRTRRTLPLNGTIETLNDSGENGLFFFVLSDPLNSGLVQNRGGKRLIALNLAGGILVNAPFAGENAFLARRGPDIFIGGGTTLASFKLGRM